MKKAIGFLNRGSAKRSPVRASECLRPEGIYSPVRANACSRPRGIVPLREEIIRFLVAYFLKNPFGFRLILSPLIYLSLVRLGLEAT